MNGLRCPKCELVNLLTAEKCHRCGASLTGLRGTAEVSVPVDQTFQAQSYKPALFAEFSEENSVGRKTFFWYRVYCGCMTALNLAIVVIGATMAFASGSMVRQDAQEALVVGILYTISGGFFAVVYLVALALPRKPYNWVVGIVMIALGLSGCCFLPATIPLLIFWFKPETKAYLGRT